MVIYHQESQINQNSREEMGAKNLSPCNFQGHVLIYAFYHQQQGCIGRLLLNHLIQK